MLAVALSLFVVARREWMRFSFCTQQFVREAFLGVADNSLEGRSVAHRN